MSDRRNALHAKVAPVMPEKLPARSAVFRADASASAGFGHVARCAALAEHLAALGWKCHLVAPLEGAAPFDLGMFASVSPPDARDAEGVLPPVPRGQAHDLLVVDHYGRDAAYERATAGAARILAFDDLAGRPHAAHVLVDSAAESRDAAYRTLVPPTCEILAGPGYAPLRGNVFAARAATLPRRDGGLRRLLVSLGSGDTAGLAAGVVEQVARLAPDCRIDIVGAAEPAAAPKRERVVVHRRTDRMIELLAAADAAVGAGGVAAWERCALGLPSVAIVTAENQRHVAATLAGAGAALVIGLDGAVDAAALAAAIGRLIADAAARHGLSRCAARLCDGLGAARLAAMLDFPATARDGARIRMRRATGEDGDAMLAWQRDPRTRAFAKNSAIPTAEEHRRWLAAKLDDPACILEIVEHGGEAAGVLRLDRRADAKETWVISIYTAPNKYRLGIAAAALAFAVRLRPRATLLAEVLPGNAASQALFRRAGFEWTRDHFERGPFAAEVQRA